MKNIIRQACYSFLCQHLLLSENSFEYENDAFDRETNLYVIKSILASLVDGTNLFVDNPEKVAETDIEKRMNKDSGSLTLDFKLPPSYPFDSLCLWYTPGVYNQESGEVTKAYHFIHESPTPL